MIYRFSKVAAKPANHRYRIENFTETQLQGSICKLRRVCPSSPDQLRFAPYFPNLPRSTFTNLKEIARGSGRRNPEKSLQTTTHRGIVIVELLI